MKYFHGGWAGSAHGCSLKSRIGKVSLLVFGPRNADSRQYVLSGKEVEALRIHKYTVVITKDGLDHPVAFKSS
jgi:hypothetical protein